MSTLEGLEPERQRDSIPESQLLLLCCKLICMSTYISFILAYLRGCPSQMYLEVVGKKPCIPIFEVWLQPDVR